MVCLENVLKISLQEVLKVSWRHLEDVFKTSWRRLEDALKRSWRCFEDVFKTSWRCLEDVFARSLEDVLKTSWKRLEDVWPKRIYWSWPRCLEDVFWRRKAKANIFVFIKTSSEDEDERCLQEVFKTSSSRRMFAGRMFMSSTHLF